MQRAPRRSTITAIASAAGAATASGAEHATLARHTHGGDVRTRLRAQSPAPPPPRPSLDARLPHMCANHRTEFDMLARSQNQLVADMFFVALDTAIMPIGGTLLGSVRSRLLCSVWDDDVDFMVSSAEYDNLLHSRSLRTSSSAVEDVSETALGERLAHGSIQPFHRCSRCLHAVRPSAFFLREACPRRRIALVASVATRCPPRRGNEGAVWELICF